MLTGGTIYGWQLHKVVLALKPKEPLHWGYIIFADKGVPYGTFAISVPGAAQHRIGFLIC